MQAQDRLVCRLQSFNWVLALACEVDCCLLKDAFASVLCAKQATAAALQVIIGADICKRFLLELTRQLQHTPPSGSQLTLGCAYLDAESLWLWRPLRATALGEHPLHQPPVVLWPQGHWQLHMRWK